MRIGGEALFYAEVITKEDCEAAVQHAKKLQLPLVLLGGGSNTLFADGTIHAFVVRIKADEVQVKDTVITVQAGKNLPMLVNELAEQGLDLSALTGIPGSVGGAVVGNAGQGPTGVWIDTFVSQVTVFSPSGWKNMNNQDCKFGYRDSVFKNTEKDSIVWEITLKVPKGDLGKIRQEIEQLLQKRVETQPYVKTSGSCFKAVDHEPAWKLIDAARLRGTCVGNVCVSEKHANFLINKGEGTFQDAVTLVRKIEELVGKPLDVEMRFIKPDGTLEF